MTSRVQINDLKKQEQKQHLKNTLDALHGKSISNLKENELKLLVEHLCALHQICDQRGIIQ